jgi:hypothetical protein
LYLPLNKQKVLKNKKNATNHHFLGYIKKKERLCVFSPHSNEKSSSPAKKGRRRVIFFLFSCDLCFQAHKGKV